MVVTYLEKIREKLQEKHIHINSLLVIANNEYKENVEFIKLLEENNDPNFEAFTPRQVNGFNKKKISELLDLQKEVVEKIDKLKEELSMVETDIEEVNTVIRIAKENQKKLESL